MKALVILAVALIASAFAIVDPVYKEWEEWKAKYKPKYLTLEEDNKRFEIFRENKKIVQELNKASEMNDGPDGARFGLNKFADLSREEFASRYLHKIKDDLPGVPILPRLYPFLISHIGYVYVSFFFLFFFSFLFVCL